MALSNLFGWGKKKEEAPASACGAADKPEEKPAACGSACGAADKPEEKPAACGAADKPAEAPAACGAADKPEEKPAACGSACGAADKPEEKPAPVALPVAPATRSNFFRLSGAVPGGSDPAGNNRFFIGGHLALPVYHKARVAYETIFFISMAHYGRM